MPAALRGRSHLTRPRASSFLAFPIERRESRENVFVGQIDWPAIGIRNRRIELVVELLEDQLEAVLEDALFIHIESPQGQDSPDR
jgi:hypothetical protein